MSKLFGQVLELVDSIDYAILLETVEGDWCADLKGRSTLYWKEDDGVYSGEIREGAHTQDGCVFINIGNGSGMTITKVLLEDNHLTEEDFYDKYEGEM